MPATTLSAQVGQLVAQRPALSRVFEKIGIDYCCGGKLPLEQACRSKGLDPTTVALMLEATSDTANPQQAVDVSAMSMTALADHIEQTHHRYLKSELPRLQPLIEKIVAKHVDKNAKLARLPDVFAALRSEMESHMGKEEQVLFPMIRQLEAGA